MNILYNIADINAIPKSKIMGLKIGENDEIAVKGQSKSANFVIFSAEKSIFLKIAARNRCKLIRKNLRLSANKKGL